MKLAFDIRHPAHINFFKNSIYELKNQGYKIIIYGLNRGKVPKILEHEFRDFDIHIIGEHNGSLFSIIFEANIFRFFKMSIELFRSKPDFGISVGGFVFGACMKLLGKKNIQFDDDPESSQNIFFEKLTATEIHVPKYVTNSKHFKTFNCLKEWAYLSPRYFSPNSEILKEYGIEADKYIFIREVSSGSLNYKNMSDFNVASFAEKIICKSHKVVFSLEDKTKRNLYPDDWITLSEPVKDIHSLIYFSSIVISSGDSMAREGSLLGRPSIYCGKRKMKANDVLIKKNMMFHLVPGSVPNFINKILNNEIKLSVREEFRNKLLVEWDDINKYIIECVPKNNEEPDGNKN